VFVSYRLLRFLILAIGIGALGGFGWRFYDFIQHRAELLGRYDLRKLRDSVELGEGSGVAVVRRPFSDFALLSSLNVTGLLPPPEADSGYVAPPPPPLVGPADIRLVYLSLGTPPFAYLVPAGSPVQAVSAGQPQIAGSLYTVGDRFRLPNKAGVELELLAIRDEEVEIGIIGKEDGAFTLRREVADADLSQIEAGEGQVAVAIQFPARTTAVGVDLYDVGTDDLAELEEMSEDQLMASVRTQPKYGEDGRVLGQRVTSINESSPLRRFGLRENDVVLDVNGVSAGDRAELVRRLRALGPTEELTVRVERLGSVRTYTYRIPTRR
jgi:hypothetical protein